MFGINPDQLGLDVNNYLNLLERRRANKAGEALSERQLQMQQDIANAEIFGSRPTIKIGSARNKISPDKAAELMEKRRESALSRKTDVAKTKLDLLKEQYKEEQTTAREVYKVEQAKAEKEKDRQSTIKLAFWNKLLSQKPQTDDDIFGGASAEPGQESSITSGFSIDRLLSSDYKEGDIKIGPNFTPMIVRKDSTGKMYVSPIFDMLDSATGLRIGEIQ